MVGTTWLMVPNSDSDITKPLPALVDIPVPDADPESAEFAMPAEPVPRQANLH